MHDVERLDLLGLLDLLDLLDQAQQHQHQHRFQVVAQLQQRRQAFPRRVGTNHLLDHLAAGLAKFRDAVKAAIAALAAQAESPAKLAEDLGLVGCFDSGVGDLGRYHSQRLREKLAGQFHRG